MNESPIYASAQGIAMLIRRGSGILGKSAMVLGVLLLAVIVAVFRLHTDGAIIGVLGLGTVIFFAWFGPIIRFAHRHPAEALLDGSQWAEHRRYELAAKGFGVAPTTAETLSSPTADPPSGLIGEQKDQRLP